MAQARAKVFAFTCIDPRFLRALETFIEKKFNLQPTEHDIKTDAGGINRICAGGPVSEWLLENAKLAYDKHGTRIFVLCNHMGCSYYQHTYHPNNDKEEFEIHRRDLNHAAIILRALLPGISVYAYIVYKEEKPISRFIFDQVLAP